MKSDFLLPKTDCVCRDLMRLMMNGEPEAVRRSEPGLCSVDHSIEIALLVHHEHNHHLF